MSGILGGLIGTLKTAIAGVTNLVINGSFNTAPSSTYWTSGGITPIQDTVFYKIGPGSLRSSYDVNADSYNAYYTASSTLTVSSYYSLSFWVYSDNANPGDTVQWLFGTNSGVVSLANYANNTWTYFKIENKQCLGDGTLRLNFDFASGGTGARVDEIYVIAGATAY